jgi:hypothetical protein
MNTINTTHKVAQDEVLFILDILLDRKERKVPYFLVGKYLSVIKDNGFHPGDDFFEWLYIEYKIEKRKAHYLIALYKTADQQGITLSQLSNTGIGWTKLTILNGMLTTDNLDHWISTARKLSSEELKKEVKKARIEKAA